MKKDKSFYGWLFTCVSLAILLGVSIYLGLSGWYFKSDRSLESDLKLGETVQVDIDKNQSSCVSFTFAGSYLPGEKLSQIIAVKNLNDSQGLYVRAKVNVFSKVSDNHDLSLLETINWTYHEDGYYYFDSLLSPLSKANLCSDIIIGEDSIFQSSKNYILNVTFEALDETIDVKNLWGYDPIKLENELT